MKHFVYILKCVDGSFYTGYTTNLEKRLSEHNGEGETKTAQAAGARYTRSRRPVTLVYFESFKTRSIAMQRECAIKRLRHQDKLRLIEGSKRSTR